MRIKINENNFPKVKKCSILAALLCLALLLAAMPLRSSAAEETKTVSTHANLVLFAYFSDETETDWFNEASSDAYTDAYTKDMTNVQRLIHYYDGNRERSFSTYMSRISGGTYTVKNIFPQYDEDTAEVTPLQLSVTEKEAREGNCDAQIVSDLETSIDLSQWKDQLDLDGDTVIDNISIILQGEDGSAAGTTLRSHKFTTHNISSWNGTNLSAYTFNMLNTKALNNKRAGLISHEYLHSLNYPDLYRQTQSDYPVGNWDIMSGDGRFMTYPLAYLRMAISGWAQIPEIDDAGTKTDNNDGTFTYELELETISDKNLNNAVMIISPVNPYEKFVIEVREKPDDYYNGDSLDGGIPASGVIVYRVDTTVENFSNFYGKTGVYVFGPGSDSTRKDAALNAANSSYGSGDLSETGNVITYSNGANTGIVVSDVSDVQNGKASLKVTVPDWTTLDSWEDTAGITGQYVTLVDLNDKPTAIVQQSQWSSVNFYEYANDGWTASALPELTDADGIDGIKLISFDGRIFASYVDGSGKGHVRVLEESAWNGAGQFIDAVDSNHLDIGAAGGRLYLSYVSGNTLYVREITVGDTAIQLGEAMAAATPTDANNFVSASRVLEQQGALVIAYKDGNDIRMKKYDGVSGFTELAGAGQASSHDVIIYNGELYFASASTTKLTVKKYDADQNTWTEFASGEIDSLYPKLAVAQGNLYVVTGPATDGKTGVYAYEVTDGQLASEGLDVDPGVDGGNYSMVASGDTLLIGYRDRDKDTAVIKKKTISNPLLSLTITPPEKISYTVGDEMSLAGLKVTANYQKNTRELAEGEYTVTGFGTEENGKLIARTAGEQTATVTLASDSSISNTFTFLISEAPSTASITSVTNNGSDSREFVYGDTIDVTVQIAEANGREAALYYQKPDGSLTKLTEPVSVADGASVRLSYDTAGKALPVGEDLDVAVCFVDGDRKTVEDSAALSLARKPVTAALHMEGTAAKRYDGTTALPEGVVITIEETKGILDQDNVDAGGQLTAVYAEADAGTKEIIISGLTLTGDESTLPYYELETTAVLEVETGISPAEPKKSGNITVGTLEAGKPLSGIALNGSFTGVSGESLAGTLNWKNPDAAFEPGTHTAEWVFTPESANYAPIEGSIEITVVKKDEPVADDPNIISYASHMQTYGWQNWVKRGTISGVTGQGKRMEAIKIKVGSGHGDLGVKYSTHVQTYGWTDYVQDGAVSGTTGEAKRVEAIKIELTGTEAENYDIYYRVHCQTYGWLDWAKNGAAAGTQGYSKRLEAIQITVVKKGAAAPGETTTAFRQARIKYRTHVQTYGWQGYSYDQQTSGTTGKGKRLEGIQIMMQDSSLNSSLTYQTHVQTYGWQNWVTGGAVSGTTGRAKRLEAIRIKLTGGLEDQYDVYYRVHAQTYGWLGWTKNGDAAGTEGLAKRLEAIEIVLVEKGGKAPGSTDRPFIS